MHERSDRRGLLSSMVVGGLATAGAAGALPRQPTLSNAMDREEAWLNGAA